MIEFRTHSGQNDWLLRGIPVRTTLYEGAGAVGITICAREALVEKGSSRWCHGVKGGGYDFCGGGYWEKR